REVSNGVITTVAQAPVGWLTLGPPGSIYFTDGIYRVSLIAGGAAAVIAGGPGQASPTNGVSATSADLGQPQGIRLNSAGLVYFVDYTGLYTLSPVSGNPAPAVAANNVWNAAGFGGAPLSPGSIATVSG